MSAHREAALEALANPIWAELSGAASRGLQSYPDLGPELLGAGPGGLRGPRDVTGLYPHVDTTNQANPVTIILLPRPRPGPSDVLLRWDHKSTV